MGSLSGNKIKDTFSLLLKMSSAAVSSSEQIVEDGAGNSTALKLSSDTVETTGALKISGTPASSTSDVQALMLSSTGVIVTRDLSSSPIGSASVTANSPLTASGSTVGVLPAGSLNQLTAATTSNVDKMLIWDETAAEYKYITTADLSSYVDVGGGSAEPTVFVGRLEASASIGEAYRIRFAEVVGSATGSTSLATSCVAYGTASTDISLTTTIGTRDGFRANTTGNYDIKACFQLTSGGNHYAILSLIRQTGEVTEMTTNVDLKLGSYVIALSKTIYMTEGEIFYLVLNSNSSGVAVTKDSSVTITKFG
jgi:hypothetical protein